MSASSARQAAARVVVELFDQARGSLVGRSGLTNGSAKPIAEAVVVGACPELLPEGGKSPEHFMAGAGADEGPPL